MYYNNSVFFKPNYCTFLPPSWSRACFSWSLNISVANTPLEVNQAVTGLVNDAREFLSLYFKVTVYSGNIICLFTEVCTSNAGRAFQSKYCQLSTTNKQPIKYDTLMQHSKGYFLSFCKQNHILLFI